MEIETGLNCEESKYCRGCLESANNLTPIGPFYKCFLEFTNIELLHNDSIHDWLCFECRAILNRFQTFKKKALEVDSVLRTTLKESLKFRQLVNEINIKKRMGFQKIISFQACTECSSSDKKNISNEHLNDTNTPGVISQDDFGTMTLIGNENCNNVNNRKYEKKLTFDHTELDERSDYDDERLIESLDAKDEISDETVEKNVKKHRKKRKNNDVLNMKKSHKMIDMKKKHKVVRKYKRREWIAKTLDIEKIKVIDLSPEEQIKELEDKRTSKDFQTARYKCEFCVKIFPYQESLQNHMLRHNESFGAFECNVCHQYFAERRVFKSHCGTHSRRYECLKCGRVLHFKTTMANHLLRHENIFICHVCGHHSQDKETYRIHQKIHLNVESFKCSMCPKVLNNKHDYGVHIRRHTGDMPFSCSECGKFFQTGAILAAHKSVHSTNRDFYCSSCDVSFKTRSIMMAHLRKSIRHIDPALLAFPCDQCPKKFKSESQRTTHVNNYHLRCAQLCCDVCPAQFVSANGLRKHRLRKHEGEKPSLSHVCETCGRGFSTKALVTNHLRTHTKERPFECETCHRRFSQKSAMKTHIKLVHLKLKDGKRRKPETAPTRSSAREEKSSESLQTENWTCGQLNIIILNN